MKMVDIDQSSTKSRHFAHTANFTLGALFFANLISHIDRHLLAMTVDQIRADVGLSDTQVGVLYGFGFSVSFALSTVVLASYSDKYSRTKIIALAIGFWSVATGLFGIASSFALLFIARLGIGVGQAALSPAVYSILADLFHRQKRGRANAIYASGSFVGLSIAVALSGFVGAIVLESTSIFGVMLKLPNSWRAGFIGMSVCGIVCSIAYFFLLRDPIRQRPESVPSFLQTLHFIRRNSSIFVWHFLGFSFAAMALFTLIAWGPTYFSRLLHLDGVSNKSILAVGFLSATITGVITSGVLTDYLSKVVGRPAPFFVGLFATLLIAVSMTSFTLVEEAAPKGMLFFLSLHFASYAISPSAFAIQAWSLEKMRSRVYALFLSINNLVGMSIGALLVGVLNDYVFRSPSSIGNSIVITVILAAIASALCLARAAHNAVRAV